MARARIQLILKAGPVLDQYDVSVGVKVWTAEAIESQPALPRKEKRLGCEPKSPFKSASDGL